jgi:hypothetical protein
MPKRQKRSAQKGRSKSNSLPHMSPVSDGPPTSKTYNTLAGRPRNWLTSREQSITVTLELTPVTFLTTSTSAAVYTAYPFALNAAAAYAEYTSLFDHYRIDGIEAYVEPFLAAQGTTVFGDVALAVDLDDSSTPSSLNTVASKQGSIVCSGAAYLPAMETPRGPGRLYRQLRWLRQCRIPVDRLWVSCCAALRLERLRRANPGSRCHIHYLRADAVHFPRARDLTPRVCSVLSPLHAAIRKRVEEMLDAFSD